MKLLYIPDLAKEERKTMATIEIYTTTVCPYCIKAKRLLDAKDLDYTEINVTGDDEARMALVEKSGGRRTVPQIFIDGKPIGGFDDMYALEQSGELDKLLSA